jgi:hypothetical protein
VLLRARLALSVSSSKSAAAIRQRRTTPIMAYVGPNGGGKSLAMVRDSIPALRAGKRVLSTVRLLDPRTGQPWPNYEPLTHADQLLQARDCEILLDEMVGIANARESMSLDPRLQNLFVQLRRRNVVVRWTAPNYARADKIIREVTQAVTECRGFFSLRGDQFDQWGDAKIWAPKRLFRFRTFETTEFEEWTSGKRDKAEPEADEWYYAPGDDARDHYDTLDAVESVAGMARNGECATCGGSVRKPVCKGHGDGDALALLPQAGVLELRPPVRAVEDPSDTEQLRQLPETDASVEHSFAASRFVTGEIPVVPAPPASSHENGSRFPSPGEAGSVSRRELRLAGLI